MVPGDQPPASKNDSRATERIKLDISIAYSLDASPPARGEAPPYRWGTLMDISERGLCFKAHDTFFVQRVIAVYLKLSHETSGIRMLAKIIWMGTDWDGASRVGLQFIGTLPSDWRELVGGD